MKMASSISKCVYCNSYDELVVVDYTSLMTEGRASGKEVFNEFDVIHQISKDFSFGSLSDQKINECLYKVSKNMIGKETKICRECYLRTHPKSVCSKCGKILFTFLTDSIYDPFSLKTLCHCWIDNVKKHIGKWDKVVGIDDVKYVCHQKKPEKTIISFSNKNGKVFIRCKSVTLDKNFIKIDGKFCLIKLYLIPQLIYDHLNRNMTRIDEQCWLEIEYDGQIRLIHLNFLIPLDIEIDLNLIEFIEDKTLRLDINGIEYRLLLTEKIKEQFRECEFYMAIKKRKYDKSLDTGNAKILEYYHDTRCCKEM